MDWYFTRETENFVVPDDQETEDVSTEKLSEKDEIPGHQCKKFSNSSANKLTSSINCSLGMSETLIQSISDFRLPNNMGQMDDTFL